MFSATLSKFIKKNFGRWLVNFDYDNSLQVTAGGNVIAKDITISTEELRVLLPAFTPVLLKIGRLELDLPVINTSNPIKATLNDVVILLKSGTNLDTYTIEDIRRALRTRIRILARGIAIAREGGLAGANAQGGFTKYGFDYLVKAAQRIEIVLQFVHIRWEDSGGEVKAADEVMQATSPYAMGVMVKEIKIMPDAGDAYASMTKEINLSTDDTQSAPPAAAEGEEAQEIHEIQKFASLQELAVYFCRDPSFCPTIVSEGDPAYGEWAAKVWERMKGRRPSALPPLVDLTTAGVRVRVLVSGSVVGAVPLVSVSSISGDVSVDACDEHLELALRWLCRIRCHARGLCLKATKPRRHLCKNRSMWLTALWRWAGESVMRDLRLGKQLKIEEIIAIEAGGLAALPKIAAQSLGIHLGQETMKEWFSPLIKSDSWAQAALWRSRFNEWRQAARIVALHDLISRYTEVNTLNTPTRPIRRKALGLSGPAISMPLPDELNKSDLADANTYVDRWCANRGSAVSAGGQADNSGAIAVSPVRSDSFTRPSEGVVLALSSLLEYAEVSLPSRVAVGARTMYSSLIAWRDATSSDRLARQEKLDRIRAEERFGRSESGFLTPKNSSLNSRQQQSPFFSNNSSVPSGSPKPQRRVGTLLVCVPQALGVPSHSIAMPKCVATIQLEEMSLASIEKAESNKHAQYNSGRCYWEQPEVHCFHVELEPVTQEEGNESSFLITVSLEDKAPLWGPADNLGSCTLPGHSVATQAGRVLEHRCTLFMPPSDPTARRTSGINLFGRRSGDEPDSPGLPLEPSLAVEIVVLTALVPSGANPAELEQLLKQSGAKMAAGGTDPSASEEVVAGATVSTEFDMAGLFSSTPEKGMRTVSDISKETGVPEVLLRIPDKIELGFRGVGVSARFNMNESAALRASTGMTKEEQFGPDYTAVNTGVAVTPQEVLLPIAEVVMTLPVANAVLDLSQGYLSVSSGTGCLTMSDLTEKRTPPLGLCTGKMWIECIAEAKEWSGRSSLLSERGLSVEGYKWVARGGFGPYSICLTNPPSSLQPNSMVWLPCRHGSEEERSNLFTQSTTIATGVTWEGSAVTSAVAFLSRHCSAAVGVNVASKHILNANAKDCNESDSEPSSSSSSSSESSDSEDDRASRRGSNFSKQSAHSNTNGSASVHDVHDNAALLRRIAELEVELALLKSK